MTKKMVVVLLLLLPSRAWSLSIPFFMKGILKGPAPLADEHLKTQQPLPAEELFELCATPGFVVDGRASELVDELCAMKAPIHLDGLGGGLWLSKFTRGPKPRWQTLSLLSTNRVGQSYDPEHRTVQNHGEILGSNLYFFADGTYVGADSDSGPVDVDVAIEKGGIVCAGVTLNLPIQGPGLLRIHYLDDRLRIFESPTASPENWEKAGLFVVQVRETALQEYLSPQPPTSSSSSSS